MDQCSGAFKIYQDLLGSLPRVLAALKQLQARRRKGKAQEGDADSGMEDD